MREAPSVLKVRLTRDEISGSTESEEEMVSTMRGEGSGRVIVFQ